MALKNSQHKAFRLTLNYYVFKFEHKIQSDSSREHVCCRIEKSRNYWVICVLFWEAWLKSWGLLCNPDRGPSDFFHYLHSGCALSSFPSSLGCKAVCLLSLYQRDKCCVGRKFTDLKFFFLYFYKAPISSVTGIHKLKSKVFRSCAACQIWDLHAVGTPKGLLVFSILKFKNTEILNLSQGMSKVWLPGPFADLGIILCGLLQFRNYLTFFFCFFVGALEIFTDKLKS